MTVNRGKQPRRRGTGAALPAGAADPQPSPQAAEELAAGQPAHSAGSPAWGLTIKAIVASAGLVLLGLIIWRFQFLISTLTLAAVLAYLLSPPIRWLARKTAIQRSQAVLVVYGLVFVLVSGLGILLAVVLAEQSARLWGSLPGFLPRLLEELRDRAEGLSAITWTLGPYSLEFSALLDLIDWEEISSEVRNAVQAVAGRGGLWLVGVAQATLGTIGEGFLVLVLSIYFAIDGPRMGQAIGEVAQQPGYRKDAERLIDETVKIWDTYLRGQVLLGIVMGVVVAVALSILGVSNSLELGLLSGLLEFLPLIGPVIGAGAAVLAALFQSTNPWGLSPWVFALIVLGAMTIIQQVQNAVLVPRIVGDALDLHPIVIMVGVIMGASLAGLLGAVLAAPVLASLKLYGTYVWRKMLDLPPFTNMEPAEDNADSNGGDWWGSILDRMTGKGGGA